MIQRVYLLIIVLGVLGGVGYFAYQYYVTTQTRIGILTANNAKLITATIRSFVCETLDLVSTH